MHRSPARFILSNFLWFLLLKHKACHIGSVGEDFFLKYADLLNQFCKSVYLNWDSNWQKRMGGSSDFLFQHIGNSLISFIKMPYYHYPNEKADKRTEYIPQDEVKNRRLVTKTPNVDNLPLFSKLFPDAHLIVLIRDGRSVVGSTIKSFRSMSFDKAAYQWRNAARKIIAFDKENRKSNKNYIIVKYEDLYMNTQKELERLFSAVDLDPKDFDHENAASLPVYGSSELKASKGKLNWEGTEKNKEFDPVNRWQNWNPKMHSRFNWIAGNEMKKLGYSIVPANDLKISSSTRNILLDSQYRLKKCYHFSIRSLKSFLKSPRSILR